MNDSNIEPGCGAGCFDHPATPAPLDPSKVKAGDTVTVRFIETGEEFTTKAYKPSDIKPAGWVSVLGWPLNKGDGTHGLAIKFFEILDHQPAPEPEVEWDKDADYVATVRGVSGLRVAWSPVDDSDRSPWRTREPVGDGKWSWHEERYVTDVRPLVVIDPERARALVHGHFDDDRSRALLDALLDL